MEPDSAPATHSHTTIKYLRRAMIIFSLCDCGHETELLRCDSTAIAREVIQDWGQRNKLSTEEWD